MRSSIVLMSAFATMALGQNSTGTTYTLPQGFNIGQVKPDELSELTQTLFPRRLSLTTVLSFPDSWCTGQRNVCPEICSTGTKQNTCDPVCFKMPRLQLGPDLIRSDQI